MDGVFERLEGRDFLRVADWEADAFELGIAELGGTGLHLAAGDLRPGRGETIRDPALALPRLHAEKALLAPVVP